MSYSISRQSMAESLPDFADHELLPIELRSDTITRPTPEMRQAMAQAEVGDDVLSEDPTVNALEERLAEVLGKEAAVYMPTATMCNQVAIRHHTEPGDEVFLDADAHIYYYEGGAPAALMGVTSNLLPAQRGIFSAETLQRAIRPANIHYPRPRLVCVENSHNRGAGNVWSLHQIEQVAHVAREHDLRLHLDGARLWNASVATGIPEKDYTAPFDTVNVCFSKGLGAPVGSALAGSAAAMERARRFRKQFGGGMRQAGIIAAGALYALEHHRDRLADDHTHAMRLAQGLAGIDGIQISLEHVQTNIVMFNTPGRDAAALAPRFTQAGVWMFAVGPERFRAVTSLEVNARQIDAAVRIIGEVMASA